MNIIVLFLKKVSFVIDYPAYLSKNVYAAAFDFNLLTIQEIQWETPERKKTHIVPIPPELLPCPSYSLHQIALAGESMSHPYICTHRHHKSSQ